MSRWAIVGLGFISPRHKAGIEHVGDKVAMTCDIDPAKKATFTSFDEMVESPAFRGIDNVAICTPNDLHIPMALKCLEKGKKVLLEKPAGLNSRAIMELPNDGSVFCVHQLRYLPAVKRLRYAPRAHKAGIRVIVPRGNSYWEGWKGEVMRSGGVNINIGVHYFDLLRYLLGDDFVPFCREVAIVPDGSKGVRTIYWDEEAIDLSSKDNLSQEDLHKHVYEDFKLGKGVLPQEAAATLKYIEKLC